MYIVRMPRLGVTMESGKVAEWLCEVGSAIKAGEPLFAMENDKALVEIEAQASGVLRQTLIAIGDEVDVNTPIALIGEADEAIDLAAILGGEVADARAPDDAPVAAVATAAPAPADRPRVSPRSRRLAAELGVDLAQFAPGAISEDSIRAAAAAKPSDDGAEFIELTQIQRAMKKHITDSWTTIPHFVQMISVDMTRALALKGNLGVAGLNDILIKIVGDVAARHPLVNGRLDGDRVRINRTANVSVAVAGPTGLVVPVIRSVEQLSVGAVHDALAALVAKANGGGLAPADSSEGTITMSNLGAFGIEEGTPVINGPQAALVFAGAIIRTPVVDDNGDIHVVPVMKLSIAFDHRFIDGVTAARFTAEVRERLETVDHAALS